MPQSTAPVAEAGVGDFTVQMRPAQGKVWLGVFFGGGSSQSFCPFQVILRGPLPQMGRTLSSTLIGTTLW